MAVEGRTLKASITTSRKINNLSAKAVILFVFGITKHDSAGFMEAEADWLKFNVVPRREDIPQEEIPDLALEIIKSGAWLPFVSDAGLRIIRYTRCDLQKILKNKDDGTPLREALSKYLRMYAPHKFEITGLRPLPLQDIEKTWKSAQIDVSSLSPHLPLTETSSVKKGNIIKSKEREDGEARPLSSKGKTVKQLLIENPALNILVDKLREGKWPEVGSWIGMAMSEVPSLQVEDLVKTLEIIDAKEKDSFKGDIFPFAKRVLNNVVNEGMTRRVEEKAREIKKEEGIAKVGEILEKLAKG